MRIVPFHKELEPRVREMNRRLMEGGQGQYCYPETSIPDQGKFLQRRYFVAVDADSEVRGGYIVRRQPFHYQGTPFDLSFLKLPVSEGTIDKRFAQVGIEILEDASSRNSALFALGMGGIHETLPRILKKMGWHVREIPFLFKVYHARRVLRELPPIRNSKGLLRHFSHRFSSCLASPAVRLMFPRTRSPRGYSTIPEVSFGDWADDIWERCRGDYDLLSERSEGTLREIYQPFSENLRIVRIEYQGKTIAWFAYLVTEMTRNSNFGNLRVATIVDGLAPLADLQHTWRAAIAHIESKKPDLLISNQQNWAWRKAAQACHFRSGPSNFAVAFSPALSESIPMNDSEFWDRLHINRGDGDGPIHL